MKNILITGGTGLVGTHLIPLLIDQNFNVAILTRNPNKVDSTQAFEWDVKNESIDPKALQWADGIIHLAGAGVADKRWTDQRKKEILESRTKSTQLLYKAIKEHNPTLGAFVSASAIGYYGFTTTDKFFEEDDAAGTDFLANVVVQWEKEVQQIAKLNIRTALIRVGIVLANEGGALPEMSKPPILAPLGSGQQWTPWIHIHDLCMAFIWALKNNAAEGPYNAGGCQPLTNKAFTKALSKIKKKPFLPIGVPPFALRLAVGEMADMLLEGSRVSYNKLTSQGFQYQFTQIESALKDLEKKRQSN